MDNIAKARDAIRKVYKIAATNPPRTLRVLSAVSGVLLVLGGFTGLFTINPLAIVISFYNMLFGLLIVLTELKSWPIIRTFQKSVDVYFHLLSIPRGKGGFYCFIGFLAFFSSDWNLSRVCVLIVSIVGVLHLFACERCGAVQDEEAPAASLHPQEMTVADSGTVGGASDSSSWAGLMKQVVADSPEVLPGMLSLASSANAACSGGQGQGSSAAAGEGQGSSGSGGSARVDSAM